MPLESSSDRNASKPVNTAALTKEEQPSESADKNLLYLYQPQGNENFCTAARLVMGAIKRSENNYDVVSVSLRRGVHLISRSDWGMVLADPSCKTLIQQRQLIGVSNGSILPRDIIEADGVNGSLRVEDLIAQTYETELLTNWLNWCNAQKFEGTRYAEYSMAIKQQIEDLNNGLVSLPVFSSDFPGITRSNQVRVL